MSQVTITITNAPPRPESMAEIAAFYRYWSACDRTARAMEADLYRVTGEPWRVTFREVRTGRRTEVQADLEPIGPVRKELS